MEWNKPVMTVLAGSCSLGYGDVPPGQILPKDWPDEVAGVGFTSDIATIGQSFYQSECNRTAKFLTEIRSLRADCAYSDGSSARLRTGSTIQCNTSGHLQKLICTLPWTGSKYARQRKPFTRSNSACTATAVQGGNLAIPCLDNLMWL